MNSMPIISIIVPVYNARRHIKKCISSILAQTMNDFELIIINDGSTDDSLYICKTFARIDKRIRIIDKENEGVSSARNIGIKAAKGDWITFIDADDYVDANYLECLYKHNDYTENILIIQGLKQVSNSRTAKNVEFTNETLTGKDIEKAFDSLRIFEYGYTVAKLYNNRIIQQKNIRFDNEISYSEDLIFMLEYILHCNSIKFIEGTGYHYMSDASNLSLRYNSFKSEYKLFECYIKLISDIARRFSFKIPDKTLRNGGLILMRCLYAMYINRYNKKERIIYIKEIRKRHKLFIREHYIPQLKLFKIIKYAFLIHPHIFDFICKIKFR